MFEDSLNDTICSLNYSYASTNTIKIDRVEYQKRNSSHIYVIQWSIWLSGYFDSIRSVGFVRAI